MSVSDLETRFIRKVKEIKYSSGGEVLYAAQSNEKTDAEIAGKVGFRTETDYMAIAHHYLGKREKIKSSNVIAVSTYVPISRFSQHKTSINDQFCNYLLDFYQKKD